MRHAGLIAACALLLASPALAFNTQRDYSDAELGRLNARLGRVAERVQSATVDLCNEMRFHGNCTVEIVMDPAEKGLNAHAKRNRIVVNPAMIEFARTDDQLAFVLAHESAHHFLGHVAAQRRERQTDLLFAAPVNAKASSIETEADYAGMYVLARAGYSTRHTGRFLKSLARTQAGQEDGSHPASMKRSIAIEKTAAEINTKQRKQLPVVPDTINNRG